MATMAAPDHDDDARALNSALNETCVMEVSVETVSVDDTDSNLSREAMLREVANDATANTDYVHQVPRAFGQPHVETAFQAQYTETRVTYVICIFVGLLCFFLGGFIVDLLGAITQLPSLRRTWNMPLSIRIALCAMFLLASLGFFCNRAKLRDHHHAMQALMNFAFVVLFVTSSGVMLLGVISGEYPSPVGAAYIGGLLLAGGTFVMTHVEASLWTFLFTAVFAVTVCIIPGSDIVSIVGTITSAVVLGSISRQIMLQHRHSFAAQVRHHPREICRYSF